MMTRRLFNGEHNLRVRSRNTILELEPALDAGRAVPWAEPAITLSSNASSKTANDLAGHAGRHFKTTECNALAKYQRNRPNPVIGTHSAEKSSFLSLFAIEHPRSFVP